MPYINAKISKSLTPEKEVELKAALGRAITAIPGKTEAYLMVCLEPDAKIWFAGENDRPMAFVDVRILGHAKPEAFSAMTAAICREFEAVLDIKPADVYVTYAEVENWGWNGRNF